MVLAPNVLWTIEEVAEKSVAENKIEMTFVDDYPIGTAEFAIVCDNEVKTYKYRVGMSLAAWAISEFNTDGWILGPENVLLSSDHQYYVEGYHADLKKAVGFKSIECDGLFRDVLFYIAEPAEEIYWTVIEKSMKTNTATVYLVDWQTALLTTGFAVFGEYSTDMEKRSAWIKYGMYDMAYGCESGEIFKIYMRDVHPSLLADVKVYAVPDNGEKTIPDNAMCFAFENVEDLSELDFYLGATMAKATYDMTADPNGAPNGDFAFAITYQDKLVYWIHMPAVTAAQ